MNSKKNAKWLGGPECMPISGILESLHYMENLRIAHIKTDVLSYSQYNV